MVENSSKLKKIITRIITEEFNRADYLKWKRKNVTYRGVQNVGQENNGSAVLGRGLYTAALSNKSMAKSYGELYFVVNAVPKNPKVFNTMNEWEIWMYNNLIQPFSKEKKYPDKRDFFAKTTIEDEMMKLGYDGVIINGREMVNYKPENVKYYRTENGVIDHYNHYVKSSELNESIENEPKLKITKEIAKEVNRYNSDEELLRAGGLSIETLDRAAFGFSDNDIKTLMPDQLKIKWKDDLENVKHEIKQKRLTDLEYAKSVDLSKPIDVSYWEDIDGGYERGFYIEDGHHRYYAAKILNKPLNVNLSIEINPIRELAHDLSYDDYHRMIFKQVKDKTKIHENTIQPIVKEFYHGTRTPLPFDHFDPKLDGSGLVSSGGQKFGGFFFTDSKENAEYYTEYFVGTAQIANLQPNPTGLNHPPKVLQQAIVDKKNYVVEDVLDGAIHSDIAVVPMSNLNDVKITGWEFVGDEESYFETLDRVFANDEDNYVNQDMIIDTLNMIEMNPNYLLNIPIFKAYYDSKR